MWNLIQFLSADVNLLVWSSRPIWCCASLFVQSANGLCWPVRSYFIGFHTSLQMFLGYRKIITISFYLWSAEMMRWTGTAAPTMQVCSFLVIYDIYLPTLLLDCFCQVTYGEARARADCTHTDSDSAWSSSHHLPYEEEERPAAACVPYLLPAPQGERINE